MNFKTNINDFFFLLFVHIINCPSHISKCTFYKHSYISMCYVDYILYKILRAGIFLPLY